MGLVCDKTEVKCTVAWYLHVGSELLVGIFTGVLAAHDVMCVVTLMFHFIIQGTCTTGLEM